MAYTFFKARGLPVGKSLVEDDKLDAARDDRRATRRRAACALELPVDHVVAPKLEAGAPTRGARGRRRGHRRSDGPRHRPEDDRGVYADVHRRREDRRLERPDGRVRDRRVRDGHQRRRAGRRRACKGTTIIGGGDSIAAVKKAGVADRITHISTGGGASLEFLGGRTLPGVAALTDK